MPDDDVSIGEIGRSVHRIEDSLGELDKKMDLWREDLIEVRNLTNQNAKDIARLEAGAAKAEARRWAVYLAVIVAALAFLSQFYFAARGSG